MNVFIIRKITFSTPFGSAHIYREAVAYSFEEAVDIASKMEVEPTPDFLFEIVKLPLGDYSDEYFYQTWYLNNQGLLMNRECSLDATSLNVDVGDFVRLLPFPAIPCSQVYVETVGLVVEKHDVGAEGTDKTNELVVMTINNDGNLDHYHVHVCSASMLILGENELPERFEFLKILRDHVTEKKQIDQAVWDEIIEEKYSILNVPQLNWGQTTKTLNIKFL